MIFKALTIMAFLPMALAVKYDFGYAECTYNSYKFKCPDLDSLTFQRERYGLTEFPDIGSGFTCIRLKSNKISRFPNDLSNLNTVVSLDLSLNRISELPVNLKDMSSLQLLDLSKNGMTQMSPITKFPPSLRGLILGDNNLMSLPEMRIPGLFVLDLSGNQFKEIPQGFCVSKELIRVDFTDNPIKGDIAHYVDIMDSCQNTNGIKYCVFVDKPELKCECESIAPLVGFEPRFCLGSLIRGEKFVCNNNSFDEYANEKLFTIGNSDLKSQCNLIRSARSKASVETASTIGLVIASVVSLVL